MMGELGWMIETADKCDDAKTLNELRIELCRRIYS